MRLLLTILSIGLFSSLASAQVQTVLWPDDQISTSYQSQFLICDDPCPWDMDDNGFTNADDLLVFLGQYGLSTDAGCGGGDFDENGQIDIDDMREMVFRLQTLCE